MLAAASQGLKQLPRGGVHQACVVYHYEEYQLIPQLVGHFLYKVGQKFYKAVLHWFRVAFHHHEAIRLILDQNLGGEASVEGHFF